MPFSWNDLQFWRKPEAVTNPRLNTLLFICRSERFSENAFKSFFFISVSVAHFSLCQPFNAVTKLTKACYKVTFCTPTVLDTSKLNTDSSGALQAPPRYPF